VTADINTRWRLLLARPGRGLSPVCDIPWEGAPFYRSATVDDLFVRLTVTPDKGYTRFVAEVSTDNPLGSGCFLALECAAGEGEEIWTYAGQADHRDMFRQSPHDPMQHNLHGLIKQAVPMVAIKTKGGFSVALSNGPAFSENYTTQLVDPDQGIARLCSGDTGEIPVPVSAEKVPAITRLGPYFHMVAPGRVHRFEGLLFNSPADNLNDMRRDVLQAIAARWGNVTDRFGITAFASNYMHVRRNETGNSTYWICPGVEYSNKQYTRDSFWQTMVLPPEIEAECYLNEAMAQTPGAERPLFTLIWGYRIAKTGRQVNLELVQKSLDYVEAHTRNARYYSMSVPGKKNFQSWYDLCAFEEDDVVTYNQGLLAVALKAARALGLETATDPAAAQAAYRALFNTEHGFYPLSEQKQFVCVDALVGDVLAQWLFGEPLLESETVARHFDMIMRASRTPYGFKVTAQMSGEYLRPEDHSASDFRSPIEHSAVGNYCYGGSWYLYDMLCLLDCVLHGVPGAEEQAIWRNLLEFQLGGTYHEFIDTQKGLARTPNYGWDAGVYALWRAFMERGLVSDRLLRAVDEL